MEIITDTHKQVFNIRQALRVYEANLFLILEIIFFFKQI